MTHPFRDCGVFEFDDEHPKGWPVCGDCGEGQEGHDGFIPLGATDSGGYVGADAPSPTFDTTHWYDAGGFIRSGGAVWARNNSGEDEEVRTR